MSQFGHKRFLEGCCADGIKRVLSASVFYIKYEDLEKILNTGYEDAEIVSEKTGEPNLELIDKINKTPINAPFPIFILESSPYLFKKETLGQDPETFEVPSILYNEFSPSDVRIQMFVNNLTTKKQYIYESEKDYGSAWIRLFLQKIFNNKSLNTFTEECSYSVPYKTKTGKHYAKVNRIIHISFNKKTKPPEQIRGGSVEWQHSWAVRGHWMRCKSLGKDREGNYTVPGFTWRTDYIKGNGPFVQKTRIIHATDT